MSLNMLPLSFPRMIRPFGFAIIIGVLVLFAPSSSAQSANTGTVTGTASDQQGAVIQDAQITLTDLHSHSQRSTSSNKNGLYVLPNIPPGEYSLTAVKSGFAKGIVSQITVHVGTQTTANTVLTIGAETTSVEVQASNEDLQTMNATVGETVDPVMVDSLPSIGRDVSSFAAFQPGVSPGGNVAGTVQDQSVYQLDGGNNSSDMDGSMASYTGSFGNSTTGGFFGAGSSGVMPMPQDSIEEFKVSTSGQTADFNNSSGLQSQVVTKRGRDQWHGSVYEYYLDSHFGANSWQNNFSTAYTPKPSYHFSRFGASAGGVILPRLYGGKTYLFANYEGFRYPFAETYERTVPSAAMMAGNLTFSGKTYSAADLKADDPRGLGMNSTMQSFWATQLPQQGTSYPGGVFDTSCGSISSSYCDGTNIIGYKANLQIPQNSNFLVVRVDHDFSEKWHWMGSLRYYKLTQLTANQVDIGGFFQGDKMGVPKALSSRPQQPLYFVTSLTTNISSNITNDFHYSFLRNFWQWKDNAAPAQISGAGGALEPLGEVTTSTTTTAAYSAVLSPFNVNTQDIRTRIWDGQDHFLRDDVTILKNNHLLQIGGQFQYNYDFHNRTDNGNSINYTTTYQIGDSNGGGSISFDGLSKSLPTSSTINARILATYYGMITDTQTAHTYSPSGNSMALNSTLAPIAAHVGIPYYNLYASDTWKVTRNLTVNYGLGYAIEMPPHESDGHQVMWVDANANLIHVKDFLQARKSAAEQGTPYNPETGFELIRNLNRKYPYNPYYGALSPRISAAWTPRSSNSLISKILGGDATVIRGGYGRMFSRINGDLQVLNPLLSPGLILAVQCRTPQANGTCSSTGFTDSTVFRFGTDGTTAPLATAPSTLPQPYFPGYSGPGVAVASPLDPSLRPSDVNSFNFSIQRQINRRFMVEAGYIGRIIRHEYTMLNPNQVPYMFAYGGQTFEGAYLAIEKALGCTTAAGACSTTTLANALSSVTAQPFFEAALKSSYCSGYANCTAAVLSKQTSNFRNQKVFSLWTALDNGNFNFSSTMMNTPISGSSYGASGQLGTGISVGTSAAWSNYNGGYVTFKASSFHGITLQENLTWGKALGLNAFSQASSGTVVNDSFDPGKNYGVQAFDQKIIFNTFIVYETPWFKQQHGLLGRAAGGWTISPVLTAGTGQPLSCTTFSGGQSFGGSDASNFGDKEQCVFTTPYKGGYHTHRGVTGGTDAYQVAVGTAVKASGNAAINMFSNPAAVYDTVRPAILGLDNRGTGDGPIRGLPYLNLDLSVKKHVAVWQHASLEFTGVFLNVMNHLDFSSPSLNISSPTSFGVTKTQGNTPRQIQLGLRASF